MRGQGLAQAAQNDRCLVQGSGRLRCQFGRAAPFLRQQMERGRRFLDLFYIESRRLLDLIIPVLHSKCADFGQPVLSKCKLQFCALQWIICQGKVGLL